MNAADLLHLLETMLDKGVPLHKLTVRVEVSDDFYDKDVSESNVFEVTRGQHGERRYLIIRGD